MNLYLLFDQVAGHPGADSERIVETLLTIWSRTLLLSGVHAPAEA